MCILKGGKLPILGRASGATVMDSEEEPTDETGGESRRIYRLVRGGGTYVHGIMDGDAVCIIEEAGGSQGGVSFFEIMGRRRVNLEVETLALSAIARDRLNPAYFTLLLVVTKE